MGNKVSCLTAPNRPATSDASTNVLALQRQVLNELTRNFKASPANQQAVYNQMETDGYIAFPLTTTTALPFNMELKQTSTEIITRWVITKISSPSPPPQQRLSDQELVPLVDEIFEYHQRKLDQKAQRPKGVRQLCAKVILLFTLALPVLSVLAVDLSVIFKNEPVNSKEEKMLATISILGAILEFFVIICYLFFVEKIKERRQLNEFHMLINCCNGCEILSLSNDEIYTEIVTRYRQEKTWGRSIFSSTESRQIITQLGQLYSKIQNRSQPTLDTALHPPSEKLADRLYSWLVKDGGQSGTHLYTLLATLIHSKRTRSFSINIDDHAEAPPTTATNKP